MKLIVSYLIGLIFGMGILFSGMANPAKVLNFFDLAGAWDPSLALVMMGAIVVTFFGYRWVLSRPSPVFEPVFGVPTRTDIDGQLVGGSLVFGIGWGIGGFCPGGAIPALGTGSTSVILFVAALVVGITLTREIKSASLNRKFRVITVSNTQHIDRRNP